MRTRRWILVVTALAALAAAGCVLTSGQFLVTFNLPDPVTGTLESVVPLPVDLNTVKAYKDHRSDVKDLTDLAFLGEFTNTDVSPVSIGLYMTPALTAYTEPTDVEKNAVLVWGPVAVPVGETVRIGWDRSAQLFRQGRRVLLDEIRGDGAFTLYAMGGSDFRVNHGSFVAVIAAAK